MSVSEDEAIRSFPTGFGGEPDGLRSRHLKDLIGPGVGSGREVLLPALASFARLVLSGNTPSSIRPFFFGANLIALQKKGGELDPLLLAASFSALSLRWLD